jgi:hypothetical protein
MPETGQNFPVPRLERAAARQGRLVFLRVYRSKHRKYLFPALRRWPYIHQNGHWIAMTGMIDHLS